MARKLYTALSLRIARDICRPRVIANVLIRLTYRPIPLTEYHEIRNRLASECGGGAETLDWLVDADILQVGCGEYVGVYQWNRGSGGGVCGGVDTLAPSSRVALAAIAKYASDKGRLDSLKASGVARSVLDLCGWRRGPLD